MQAALRATRPRTIATPRAMPMKLARFWLVCAFFLFWAVAIATRLFWLQIIRHSDYVERAQKQQQPHFHCVIVPGLIEQLTV